MNEGVAGSAYEHSFKSANLRNVSEQQTRDCQGFLAFLSSEELQPLH